MTLKRIFNWVVGLPLAVIAIVFAVANRQWIVVSFDPIHRDAPLAYINMPQWVLVFCGVLIAGWIAAWFAHGKWRRSARDARIELMRAQQEHEKLRKSVAGTSVAVSGGAP